MLCPSSLANIVVNLLYKQIEGMQTTWWWNDCYFSADIVCQPNVITTCKLLVIITIKLESLNCNLLQLGAIFDMVSQSNHLGSLRQNKRLLYFDLRCYEGERVNRSERGDRFCQVYSDTILQFHQKKETKLD